MRLAESQGHQLKKHGKDYALNCPFHEDKTASLIITPTSNLWHCMGACNQGGSVIDWVMKAQGVSFRFACELLQKDLGLVLDVGTKASKQNTTTKLPPPLAANADNQTALKQVIDYYHETLKQSPEAQEYLRSRGLAHPELIDAMTFWVHGFRNVTSSYGTSGFTASHLAAFKQHEIKRVLIAHDRDEAGNRSAAQLAEKLQREGIECYRLLLPKGMDVNEYAQQVTPAQKSLGLVIRKAEWMGSGTVFSHLPSWTLPADWTSQVFAARYA